MAKNAQFQFSFWRGPGTGWEWAEWKCIPMVKMRNCDFATKFTRTGSKPINLRESFKTESKNKSEQRADISIPCISQ